jgi:hypothetical protein
MLLDIENKAIAEAYLKMKEAAAAKKKTDPIGKEDADIDNDGDTDSSDEYLHARRKAIAAKTKSEAMEVELPAKSKMGSSMKKDEDEDDQDEDEAVVVVKSSGGNKKKQDKESMEEGWEEKGKTKPAKPGVVTDKSGAKHDQMSRVRALANAAMQRTAAQQKNVKEDAESIDELSTNKLLNYRAAATKQLGKTSPETEQKRKAGLATSGTKIKSQLKKEDYESIDELSKDTLGSYVKKASVNAAIKRKLGADAKNSSQRVRNPLRKATLNAISKDLNSDSRKRQAGIGKAVDRLTKEDYEIIAELDNRTSDDDRREQRRNTPEERAKQDAIQNARLKSIRPDMRKKLRLPEPKAAMQRTSAQQKNVKEDYESIDELSKDTLKSYADKGMQSANKLMGKANKNFAKSFATTDDTVIWNKGSKQQHAAYKRNANVQKAKARLTKEDAEWDWDAIFDAPEHEIDTMIDEMSDQDLDSFVSEFEQIEEGSNWYQGSTNSTQPSDGMGREKLKPRAEADAAFADAHTDNVKVTDYPGKNDQHQAKMPQAPARPGDKRNSEAKKTLSDMRSGKK